MTMALATVARSAEPVRLGPVIAPALALRGIRLSLSGSSPAPAAEGIPSFRSQHPLLGRISANIDRMGLSAPVELLSEPISLTEIRNRGVLRATKKALKGFILEDMEIYHRDSRPSSGGSGQESRAMRVHFGVSHLAPKVDLQCRAGAGTVGFSLSALGTAGVDINPSATGSARIHLGYDARSKSSAVGLRLAF